MLDINSIKKLDSQNMLSSIEVLHKQCQEAWDATYQIELPNEYKNINKIVLFGMGGSALGIDIVKNLFQNEIPAPIEIVNDYSIPACVDENTLAILSSYSGTTEETVEITKTILNKTKKIFVITTGGDLQQFAEKNDLPAYIFAPTFNPSNQPRMAVGYSVMGTLGLFSALELIKLDKIQVLEMVKYLEELNKTIGAEINIEENKIKELAETVHNKLPIFISSEFLLGSTHVLTNQVNENSKQFATRFPIPEMNHHLIEGLLQPQESLKNLIFLFIKSDFYNKRNQLRHNITKNIVEKNSIQTAELTLNGKNSFIQCFELLAIGSYLSFYLAILNNLDPSPIPNVDLLKKELQNS